jgi:predicted nucleic acid-binding protein
MRLVLDASVAVAAARPNEPSHAASRARIERVLAGSDEIVVPAIFPIEVGASLARVGDPAGGFCQVIPPWSSGEGGKARTSPSPLS